MHIILGKTSLNYIIDAMGFTAEIDTRYDNLAPALGPADNMPPQSGEMTTVSDARDNNKRTKA